MPHLVKERRSVQGHDALEPRRPTLRHSNRWRGVLPEADLDVISLASVAHRLARFGIDADAEPLLERRKRGF
jgi:hypothetical protein